MHEPSVPFATSHKQLHFSTIMDIPPTNDIDIPLTSVPPTCTTCTYDDRSLFLSDIYRRLAIFHNLIGAVYYHKSQYGLAVQHFRRGIQLLIKEERQLYEAEEEGADDEAAIKCTEMDDKMEALRSKHDRMIRSTIHHRRHNPATPLPTQMNVKVGLMAMVRREPPILIDGRGNFHCLHTDGTSSIASPTIIRANDSSSHLCTSVVSSVIIHNLALSQSSIGNYSKAMELIQMSRETILVTPSVIAATDLCNDPAQSIICPYNNNTLRPPASPQSLRDDAGDASDRRLLSSDTLLWKCLNQLERRLTEESVASFLSEVNDRSGDAAPSA